MNSDYIKASVACYFRYKKQCPLICFERSVWGYGGQPDILTINKHKQIIEVEVKVSMSDMKNDPKKRIWKMREKASHSFPMPYQFYYAVPSKIQDKALNLINTWKNELYGNSGLLIVHEKNPKFLGYDDVSVAKKAPINKQAQKLSIKQIIQMTKNQTGTLCSLAINNARNNLINYDNPIEYYI